MSRPKVIFVMGMPGVGKGTQCQKLAQHFGLVHISAGELLRQECQLESSKYGMEIKEALRNGTKMVEFTIVLELLESAMVRAAALNHQGFLIDGILRDVPNLTSWNSLMAHKVDLQFILYFNCAAELCVERCIYRGQQTNGRRDDDRAEVVPRRIETFRSKTLPVIEYYRNLGILHEIDASTNEDMVFQRVQPIFTDAGF